MDQWGWSKRVMTWLGLSALKERQIIVSWEHTSKDVYYGLHRATSILRIDRSEIIRSNDISILKPIAFQKEHQPVLSPAVTGSSCLLIPVNFKEKEANLKEKGVVSHCFNLWSFRHLGGLVVEHLPLAHDSRIPRWRPTSDSLWGACFSLCLCLSFPCVSHE